MNEVLAFADDVEISAANVKSRLNSIKTNMELFGAMDSFNGKTAKSAKNYLKKFHYVVIDAFDELFEDLQKNLKSHVENFQSDVDSSNSALIDSNYLKDYEGKITLHDDQITEASSNVKTILRNISDISSVSAPDTTKVKQSKKEMTKTIHKLDRKLASFTSDGKKHNSQTKALMEHIEMTLTKAASATGEKRYSDYKSGSANKCLKGLGAAVSLAKKARTAAIGGVTSYSMYQAGKDLGLSVVGKDGKYTYRATEEALKHLGVEPDANARNTLNQKRRPGVPKAHWKEETRLKYMKTAPLHYVNNKGKPGWSITGQNVLKKHPQLEYWNPKATTMEKAKTVGKATLKGTGKAFKDIVDVKAIAKSGGVKGATKALGPLGAGLSYYSNYHDAKDAGLSGKEAATRATVDTAIDTAVGAAVQTAFTVGFTAAIPIPGVGTAIGVGLGLAANHFLNKKFGKGKKSAMDKLKGWFR